MMPSLLHAVVLLAGYVHQGLACTGVDRTLFVPQHLPIGTEVTKALTSDNQSASGEADCAFYVMQPGDDCDGYFRIHTTTGVITVTKSIDLKSSPWTENNGTCFLEVEGSVGLRAISFVHQQLTVVVNGDFNDPPKFDRAVYHAYLPFNATQYTPIRTSSPITLRTPDNGSQALRVDSLVKLVHAPSYLVVSSPIEFSLPPGTEVPVVIITTIDAPWAPSTDPADLKETFEIVVESKTSPPLRSFATVVLEVVRDDAHGGVPLGK